MATTKIAETDIAEALKELAPFLKPGFAKAWRKAGRVGYRNLGHALKGIVVSETNGHGPTPTVAHEPPAPKA